MPIIQTRLFVRTVDTANSQPINAALDSLQTEVNAFLATLTLTDVLGVEYNHDSAVVKSTVNSWFVMSATVVYLAEGV